MFPNHNLKQSKLERKNWPVLNRRMPPLGSTSMHRRMVEICSEAMRQTRGTTTHLSFKRDRKSRNDLRVSRINLGH